MFSPRFHNNEAKIKYKEFAKMDSTGASTRKIDTDMERSAALAYLRTANLDAHDMSIFLKKGNIDTQVAVDNFRQTVTKDYSVDASQDQVIDLDELVDNIEAETPEIDPDHEITSKKKKFWQKFHNPQAKLIYDHIVQLSDTLKAGKKKVDTNEEQQRIIQYIYENSNQLDSHDLALLVKLAGIDAETFSKSLPILKNLNIEIEEVSESTTVLRENNRITIINERSEEVEQNDDVENEQEIQDDVIEEDNAPKSYTVKAGDCWYKMISEQYDAVGSDINLIVRYMKDAYWEENKANLIRQGHTSSKSNFFYNLNETVDLPAKIEINGKTFKLK